MHKFLGLSVADSAVFEICIKFWVYLWKIVKFQNLHKLLGLPVADCAVFEICIEFWVYLWNLVKF